MSYNRSLSRKRQVTEDALLYKQKGKICRYCKSLVSPPRRSFCSDDCVHEWRIRSNNKYLRLHIYKRDSGICAICKTDTRYQKIDIENLKRKSYLVGTPESENEELQLYLKSIKITLKESEKSLWHADHIIPVSKGGGESAVTNIRTLCIRCHKMETKKLRQVK
jgi:5-methylcytosine-specific restriction protein A